MASPFGFILRLFRDVLFGVTTQTFGQRRSDPPPKATRFIGRKRELSAIAEALDEHRLVTLHGPGGVGKTRLALAVAAGARAAFGQEALLVELSALRNPELLAAEVAKALGLPNESAGRPAEALARQLAESELLLLLDTCEHLVAACADLVNELLDSCPDLRILATSRAPLGVQGEHVVPVSSLAADSPQSDAVELFLDRARAAVPDYALTPANSGAVVTLCRKLDGIPLAIELAAVRLRTMSADEIASRLDDRFRILGTSRTLTDRHRTLRAAVGWSYDLCSPAEQRLWARLSVFFGGFTQEAAEAVCGPGTAEMLARLAQKSIIEPWERPARLDQAVPGAVGRYRMLDTMREFAAEMVTDADGADARRRHRDYFLGLAERAAAHSAGREQVSWLAWTQLETGNLRAALDHGFGTPGEEPAGLALTLALSPYWLMLGSLGEARRWHELALAARPGPRENAWASYGAGVLAAQQSDLGAAAPLLDRAAALARDLPDPKLAAHVTRAQGTVAFYAGDNEAALGLFGSALASFEETGFGDPLALACYSRLASACLVALDLDRAIALCEECMRRCEATGEQWARSTAVWVRGAAHWMSGDIDQAIQDALTALEVKQAIGDLHTTPMCIDLIAVCLVSRGAAASGDSAAPRDSAADFARAAELCGAGDAIWRVLNAPARMGPTYAEIRKDAAAKCRNALGDERFDAAYGHGMAMSLAEAIAAARDETPAPAPGPLPLTRRERQIAALVASGLGNREIAEQLFLSKRTIDSHIEHIFTKLGFTSRTQLANWVAAEG
jgi:predicted ATPase/DNA-binding CsgD family transcriptional regulator